MAALWLDAVLSVEVVHRIEPRTQATRRDDDVNVVRPPNWQLSVSIRARGDAGG